MTMLKTGDYKEAIQNCTNALQIDFESAKALYIRSQAYLKLENFPEATADCKAAIQLEPNNKSLRTHWENIKSQASAKGAEERKKNQEQQAKAFQKGLGLYEDKTFQDRRLMPSFSTEHQQVYMDIVIGKEGDEGHAKGRIVIELFNKHLPRTCENFRALCTGERGQNLFYKTRKFDRIVPGFMMQGGNIATGNGTGAQSIYGTKFEDE